MLTEIQDLVMTTTEACPLSRNEMLCILTCKSHACFHLSDIAATTAMVLEPVSDSLNAIVDGHWPKSDVCVCSYPKYHGPY